VDIEANRHDDYLRHDLHEYDELPIWIAVETMSFGRLVTLFQLLDPVD
jgi:abortive infection bacteriophage resistance protein